MPEKSLIEVVRKPNEIPAIADLMSATGWMIACVLQPGEPLLQLAHNFPVTLFVSPHQVVVALPSDAALQLPRAEIEALLERLPSEIMPTAGSTVAILVFPIDLAVLNARTHHIETKQPALLLHLVSRLGTVTLTAPVTGGEQQPTLGKWRQAPESPGSGGVNLWTPAIFDGCPAPPLDPIQPPPVVLQPTKPYLH